MERRKKRAHYPDYNLEIMNAHEQAPAGKKLAAAIAVGEQHGRTPEAVKKQIKRLRKRGFSVQQQQQFMLYQALVETYIKGQGDI